MPQTVKLSAFLVANQLDIKGIKTFLDIKPLADTSSELFYRFSEAKFQYYFNFGVIVLPTCLHALYYMEDKILKDKLYATIMDVFLDKIKADK